MPPEPSYLVEWAVVVAGLRDVLRYLQQNGAGPHLDVEEVVKEVEHAVRQRQQGHAQEGGTHEWLPRD